MRLIFEVGKRQRIYVEPDLPAGDDERLVLLAFSTPDLDALAAHLTAKGVTVTPIAAMPAMPAMEGRAIGVTDPDGHPLAFVEREWPARDQSKSWRPAGVVRKTPLSTRILHAGLTIRDEAAATRFYKDVLGFSEIWRGGRSEGVTDWVNMRVPDGTDYLEYMLVSSAPDRRQRGVLHHVALLVPDIQAAWEAAGARTPAGERAALGPPNVGRNGRWQLNLYDTDGTRTELMEPFRVR
jgi:lactoylglutathione lyase